MPAIVKRASRWGGEVARNPAHGFPPRAFAGAGLFFTQSAGGPPCGYPSLETALQMRALRRRKKHYDENKSDGDGVRHIADRREGVRRRSDLIFPRTEDTDKNP
jgi:hypothetical protein